jgi:membrane fusion protein (multidrug efflux system)
MEHRDCLVVPAESIVNDDTGQPGVSVVRGDHETASREPVKVGLRDGDDVEISGNDLQPGTLIVTKGAAALKDVSGIAIKK